MPQANWPSTRSFRSTTSHVGLCVSNLERSRRFYVDGLGFTEFARFEIDRPIAEVDLPCSLTSLFVQKDGLRVELLDFRSPPVFGTPHRPTTVPLGPPRRSSMALPPVAEATRAVKEDGPAPKATPLTLM